MMRAYVLTRLKNPDGIWEYTRYLAESNAVVERNAPELLENLPRPLISEYNGSEPQRALTLPEHDTTATQRADTMDDAIAAIRERDFDRAITFFEEYLEKQPNYHVGWLRVRAPSR